MAVKEWYPETCKTKMKMVKVKGGLQRGNVFFPAKTPLEFRLQRWLGESGSQPLPLPVIEQDKEAFFVGRFGRYPAWCCCGPSALRISLRFAVDEEAKRLRESAHPLAAVQQPRQTERAECRE